mmetsp:Transcript_20561/g.48250  ORF Transcript_20561/g.48250 Transcript_20561/m.48250 type:complete len:127 (-) Transcript_20561:456-836(-)
MSATQSVCGVEWNGMARNGKEKQWKAMHRREGQDGALQIVRCRVVEDEARRDEAMVEDKIETGRHDQSERSRSKKTIHTFQQNILSFQCTFFHCILFFEFYSFHSIHSIACIISYLPKRCGWYLLY